MIHKTFTADIGDNTNTPRRFIRSGTSGSCHPARPAQHRGKRSAGFRTGTNRRFPANLAESEFGAPLPCQETPRILGALSYVLTKLLIII
jgi:hypothetical protein